MNFQRVFSNFANRTARATGTPWAFILCLLVVVTWAVSGPVFGFSDTWQLVINTGTTIVTFLMVFLIQNTQNRDGLAIQTKLDELILTSDAEDDFIGIEKLTDKELETLQARCAKAAEAHTRMSERVQEELSSRGESEPGAKPPARKAAPRKSASAAKSKPPARGRASA
jgi:low affinity Fe/Cu permease